MKISRRGLLKLIAGGFVTVASGVAGLAYWRQRGETTIAPISAATPVSSKSITINLNGATTAVDVNANWTLLNVLRNNLGLTGTKAGCLNSECGACTVLLDGTPIYSCHRLAIEVDGHSVTTIEGISPNGELSVLQQAFVEKGASQCGYCTPGFIMTATALLKSNPNPNQTEVVEALSGNICRCCNYVHITNAVLAAAQQS